MKLRPVRSQFQHVAQNRDTAAALAGLCGGKQRQCGAHRRRIGIVAFVDQLQFAARQLEALLNATALRRLGGGKCQRRPRQIRAVSFAAARTARLLTAMCSPGTPSL